MSCGLAICRGGGGVEETLCAGPGLFVDEGFVVARERRVAVGDLAEVVGVGQHTA